MKQSAFKSKVFPVLWGCIFPMFGIKCNCYFEMMVRLDGSLVGGSNALTWQDKNWQQCFGIPCIFLFYFVHVIQNVGATPKGNVAPRKRDNGVDIFL